MASSRFSFLARSPGLCLFLVLETVCAELILGIPILLSKKIRRIDGYEQLDLFVLSRSSSSERAYAKWTCPITLKVNKFCSKHLTSIWLSSRSEWSSLRTSKRQF